MEKDKGPPAPASPLRLVLVVLAIAFAVEAVIMHQLLPFHDLPPAIIGLIDAAILTAVLVPVLYFFVYRPLGVARETAVTEAVRAEVERKRREDVELLRQSEERFKLIADTIEEVFWMSDPRIEKIFYVSPGYERVWKCTTKSVYENPRSFMDAIHPEDREQVLRDFEATKRGETFEHQFRIIRPDGTIRWIWDRGFPVRGNGGKVDRYVGVAQDITEHRVAEEKLTVSEERFRGAFQSSAIGMAITGLDGRFLQVNHSLCDIVGYTEEEMLTRTFQDITHPDDLEADLIQVQKLLAGEAATFNLEKRYFHKLGNIIWINLSGSLVRDARGDPMHFVVHIENITARKELAKSFAKAQANMQEAQHISHIGSWEWEADGGRTFWSDENFRILGYQPGEVAPSYENFLARVHPEDRGKITDAMDRAVRENSVFDREFRIVRKDSGAIRALRDRGKPSFGPGGKFLGFVGTTQDITEYKQGEEALRASEEQFRSLVDNIGIGVSLISPNMEIISMNRQMRDWFPAIDTSERPICYKAFNAPPRESTCVYCPTSLTLADGQVHESVTETPMGDEIVNYLVRSSPIKDEKGNVTAAIELVEDVTVKKRAEDRLKNVNAKLSKALEDLKRAQTLVLRSEKLASIGTLSAGVAHEILNPLNIMGTIIQLLLMDDLTPENKEQLEEVMRQVRRATKITDNLRMFAHQHKEEITLVNAHNLFDQTAALLEHDLNLDNIVIERHYAKDFPAIYADEDKLAQVFLNLVNNARDALKGKGNAVISVTTAREGDTAVITIADNGTGIPPDVIGKVFDPFFSTKDPGQGTGLGLSMAHTIIESHDGTIEVSSEPGKGAAFTIRLPVERTATALAGK